MYKIGFCTRCILYDLLVQDASCTSTLYKMHLAQDLILKVVQDVSCTEMKGLIRLSCTTCYITSCTRYINIILTLLLY